MNDSKREDLPDIDDLTVQDRDQFDNLIGGWRYLREGEFDAIAKEAGYVKLNPYGDLRKLRVALRRHGHENGLRAALLEWSGVSDEVSVTASPPAPGVAPTE